MKNYIIQTDAGRVKVEKATYNDAVLMAAELIKTGAKIIRIASENEFITIHDNIFNV